MQKIPMTPGGYKTLETELKKLKHEDRPSIIEAISVAREHGDLKENAEYHAAKERQAFTEGRILELEAKLGQAEVIDISSMSGDTIKFGATVKVLDEDTEQQATYQLVGEDESDIKAGKLSIGAPLAKKLIGKKVGDSVEINTPKGEKGYEILDISYIG